jgi:uncharacterized membrane protein
MDPTVSEWLNLVFRWLHVIAGVMWIGHLWFFNFVNAQLAKTYTPESKKAVLPELMPRALYFFRWGAAYTFITGILLFGIVYSMSVIPGAAAETGIGSGAGTLIVLAAFVVGFGIYDALWKSMKNETTGGVISFVLLAIAAFALSRVLDGRTLFITIGGLLGSIMAANVWMRIWPNQRKIIAGVKGTAAAPGPEMAAMAGLRSKHNTYMSMPLMLFMVSNHFPSAYGNRNTNWVVALLIVLVGWGITKFLYNKSATAAPATF